ncbi:FecR family protein [Mucilaginibacter pineti]|uniref:FecR family protein n=1 Tax=Mucilaginibacter pineti TaxID=1391627 RepID=A0A1G7E4J8_9SPHI|nr:FecR family protein [Mucilaginibacter pineti]SDE58654.1 FecR family protein [Mucilaginibacter pineti]
MTYKELKKLHERCTSGKATPEEQKLFEEYRDSFDLSDIPWLPVFGDEEIIENKLRDDLHKRLDKAKIKRIRPFYWSAAAACILIFLGGLLYTLKNNTRHDLANSIKPGSNKAILTLANGRNIALDDSKNGTLLTQNNVSVDKNKNGFVTYRREASVKPHSTEIFNVMTTPRGGKYELVLADGTKVWLNAATSLKFPVDFTGKERVVNLTGEAYFEVAHNAAKPFKVISNGQVVQVLGTHFNVNAYQDEDAVKTTLLEGLVKVYSKANPLSPDKSIITIKPNEQAVFKNDQFSKTPVDGNDFIAWQRGSILFKKADLKQIMRQIARWYDVEVVYQGQVTDDTYSGEIARNSDISEVIRILKLNDINLKVDGRKVIVSP